MSEFGFVEGEDFSSCVTKTALGRNRTDFIVTLDMAKELAMVERNEMGRKMRRHFIECEKRLGESRPTGRLEEGSIPTSTLLKLQAINDGVISELGAHQARIEELESHMRPGDDWMTVLEYCVARGWELNTGKRSKIAKTCTHRSAVEKQPIGKRRVCYGNRSYGILNTYAPAVLAAVVPVYVANWQRKALQQGGAK